MFSRMPRDVCRNSYQRLILGTGVNSLPSQKRSPVNVQGVLATTSSYIKFVKYSNNVIYRLPAPLSRARTFALSVFLVIRNHTAEEYMAREGKTSAMILWSNLNWVIEVVTLRQVLSVGKNQRVMHGVMHNILDSSRGEEHACIRSLTSQ